MRAIVLFFLLTGMLSATAGSQKPESQKTTSNQTKKLDVLSTIKPVQALVLAVAGDQVKTSQLIPDFASPHFYTFKPSDLRKIHQADIIFRIDPSMEVMLNHVLEDGDLKSQVVSLADSVGVVLLPMRQVDAHEGHKHEAQESHEGNHNALDKENKAKQKLDMHIWTSPVNAVAMAKKIAQVLAAADPEHKDVYDANAGVLIENILQTSRKISGQLKTVQNQPSIVFHDSWQYFAKEFNLQTPLVASYQEGIAAGAKTLPRIRKQIESQNIHCIFTQPNMNLGWVDTLIEDMPDMKVKDIDVTASKFTMGSGMYPEWLAHLGSQVYQCLEPAKILQSGK